MRFVWPWGRVVRTSGTRIERLLGWGLAKAGLAVVAQHPVEAGGITYRCDFAVPELRLDIEADGPLHRTPGGMRHDQERNIHLRDAGWYTLRFGAREIEEDPLRCGRIARRFADKMATGWRPEGGPEEQARLKAEWGTPP